MAWRINRQTTSVHTTHPKTLVAMLKLLKASSEIPLKLTMGIAPTAFLKADAKGKHCITSPEEKELQNQKTLFCRQLVWSLSTILSRCYTRRKFHLRIGHIIWKLPWLLGSGMKLSSETKFVRNLPGLEASVWFSRLSTVPPKVSRSIS